MTDKSRQMPYSGRYQKLYRAGLRRLVDGTGTRRKLQALQVIGYTQREMAESFGRDRADLGNVMHGRRAGKVHIDTARMVDAFYKAHSHIPVWHTSPSRKKARTYALKYGWAPPAAWDDIEDPNDRPKGFRICSVDGCQSESHGRGMCWTHYDQWNKARKSA